jgi:hypothetical protein
MAARSVGAPLGAGAMTLWVEDEKGRRRSLGASPHAQVPSDAKRLIAVFRGVDAEGEPLVAVEDVSVPLAGSANASQ